MDRGATHFFNSFINHSKKIILKKGVVVVDVIAHYNNTTSIKKEILKKFGNKCRWDFFKTSKTGDY